MRAGQLARIRLPAFNQRTTPEINGTVMRVSADTSTDQRSGQSFYTTRIAMTQDEIARLLNDTDPRYVNLCLDTGHVAYCNADNLALIRDFPERIAYVHLKQVNPTLRDRAHAERMGFPPACRAGVMVEPPLGVPEMPPVLEALAALDRDLWCIVEQDMIGCSVDAPFPVAKRTCEYFASVDLGAGRPLAAR